ncbi:MAG: hypothetical protein JWN04_3755 [Myxococcaceae bacterium]|nr:hypothetical protein [Myxococcaceae bacterium]
MNDAHHFVLDGRRWRRTDPSIPDPLRTQLVHELMRARRAVGAAKRTSQAAAERLARQHVQDAKVALGERGPRWWEPQTELTLRPRIEAAIRALLRHRGVDKTICPSDVARVVGGNDWRKWMQAVRNAALALVEAGELEIRQKGKVVRPNDLHGPIRIALPRATPRVS